jgi:hypothetical protein
VACFTANADGLAVSSRVADGRAASMHAGDRIRRFVQTVVCLVSLVLAGDPEPGI